MTPGLAAWSWWAEGEGSSTDQGSALLGLPAVVHVEHARPWVERGPPRRAAARAERHPGAGASGPVGSPRRSRARALACQALDYDHGRVDTTRSAFADVSEQLLEALADAIVIVGMDGTVVGVNRQAELLSGYSRQELVGLAVDELVPGELRSGHVAHRTAYQRDPAVRSMGMHLDIRFRRRDGSQFPADIALSPVMTEQGVLVVASVRDVTERKRVEAELLQAQERFRLVVEGVRGLRHLHAGPGWPRQHLEPRRGAAQGL